MLQRRTQQLNYTKRLRNLPITGTLTITPTFTSRKICIEKIQFFSHHFDHFYLSYIRVLSSNESRAIYKSNIQLHTLPNQKNRSDLPHDRMWDIRSHAQSKTYLIFV